jgi:V8-like Glu-specific endopeptidase
MKQLLALAILVLTVNAKASMDVVYGEDNRQDLYQVKNPLYKKLAESTAAMIPTALFKKSVKPGFFDLLNVKSLERAENICPKEAFAHQPVAASCSGFLVSPDTLVTAGHCFRFDTPANICKKFAWAFGFEMKSSSANPTRNIPIENVYLCKQVLAAQLKDELDFSVIKLDRPVIGREPLKFKTSGKIAPSTPLVVIGHPTGLPLKISPAGKVTRNEQKNKFSTNLDTFHGNSGSAVFNASTGELVGILIQGKADYMPSKKGDDMSCKVVNVCDDKGKNCTAGEEAGRIKWGEVVMRMEVVAPTVNKGIKTKVR